jgi:hypothetical protein
VRGRGTPGRHAGHKTTHPMLAIDGFTTHCLRAAGGPPPPPPDPNDLPARTRHSHRVQDSVRFTPKALAGKASSSASAVDADGPGTARNMSVYIAISRPGGFFWRACSSSFHG